MMSWFVMASVLLFPGEARVVPTDGVIERVAVGSGAAVEARVLESEELLLMALQPGQSEVLIWTSAGKQRLSVRVQNRSQQSLLKYVTEMSRDEPQLQVSTEDEFTVVAGKASPPALRLLEQIAQYADSLIVAVEETSTAALPVIEMEVQLMEFKQRRLRSLGIRWQQVANGPAIGVISDWAGGSALRAALPDGSGLETGADTLGRPGHYGYVGLSTVLSSQLRWLEERGEARMLASPVLRTESGTTAQFLAGGEVPLPQTSLQGQQSVDFRTYGIQLHIEPQYLDDGTIRTRVITEVSNLDPAVTVAGIPGLLTRRSDSVVALPAGETFVMSGLMSEETSTQQQRLPGLAGLPGVGGLFRNTDTSMQETELVLFVTPRLVNEHKAGQQQREQAVRTIQQRLIAQGCRGMRSYL